MTVIATNTSALRAANASSMANSELQTAMQRLSTGKRINSAKDDAAGLAIAASMTTQITGMNQGIRNANDGISMAQTAEGALDEVTNMLQRMRELAVQANNGTYSTSDKSNIAAEQKALADQITSVLTNTQFNGQNLFDGTAGTSGAVTIQSGANTADTVTLTFADIKSTGAINTAISGASATTPLTNLANFDAGIAAVGTARAGLGAAQNQLQSAVNNLTNNSTNLSAARSRIQDTDYSAESTAMAKAQILSQASTAMIAQANQSQQNVLSLLK